MARRLPENIRHELPSRAKAGAYLDTTYPTQLRSGDTVPAIDALTEPLSEQCIQMVQNIHDWLSHNGVEHFHMVPDIRGYGQRGLITVIWETGPTAIEVATAHAVGDLDGFPLLPAWITLKTEHDFDLRWQPPY